ncbi:MAG: hypothetical protein ACYC99_02250 [Candidatus Geothermincolia bacterium]
MIEAGESLFPVAIKSAQTHSAEMLEGVLWWTKLAGVSAASATLVYAGHEAFTRRDVAVRPWFAV